MQFLNLLIIKTPSSVLERIIVLIYHFKLIFGAQIGAYFWIFYSTSPLLLSLVKGTICFVGIRLNIISTNWSLKQHYLKQGKEHF